MELLLLIIGFSAGCIISLIILKYRFDKKRIILNEELISLKNQVSLFLTEKAKYEEKTFQLNSINTKALEEISNERNKVITLTSSLAKAEADLVNLNNKLMEQKAEVENIQSKFTLEFKNLANELLEDKSRRFTEQNKVNIDAILLPLQQKIKDFEVKVSEAYLNESRERASLAEQIKHLTTLNQQITKEAENLTTALKGQSKTQGDWGELILEEILEKSGLVKGTHYVVQQVMQDEDGKIQKPDVIINLPENKNLIIDSKVSLTAYAEFCKSDNSDFQKISLNKHIDSIRKHIKELSEKRYQNIYKIQSLDFVLMFVPIEPAFVLAVKNDVTLFNDAFEKNIVIVTTSTLLATLKTIASIWKQENQSKNAMEIAKKSGDLYDKFVDFLNDLKSIGEKIQSSQKAFDTAMNKLTIGRGNLIRRAEELKSMGAKTSKSIDNFLVSKALENDLEE